MTAKLLAAKVGFVLVMLHSTVGYGQGPTGGPNSVRVDSGEEMFHVIVEPVSSAARGATNAMAAAVATSDAFMRFVRYPAEERVYLSMNAPNPVSPYPQSFFRDFFSGGETSHSGGTDGDALTAQITPPGGSSFTFTVPVSFDGPRNCWIIAASSPDCIGGPNTPNIHVYWVYSTQCRQTGDWRMEFFRNATSFSSAVFRLTPSINPDQVAFMAAPAYNQGTYATVQYGDFCVDPTTRAVKRCSLVTTPANPDPTKVFISRSGCLLVDYAAALRYHGVPITVTELNTALGTAAFKGYNDTGEINPWRVVKVANFLRPDLEMSFMRRDGHLSGGEASGPARDAVCRSGPTPIWVKSRQHFVNAWGRPETESTYLLKDPDGGLSNTLGGTYSNLYYGTRELRREPTTFVFPGGLMISLGSPAELLLTDPSGRRTGIDPLTNTVFSENPDASYGGDSISDPSVDASDPPVHIESKSILLSPVPSGTYTLRVTGTGSGTYSLGFSYTGSDFADADSSVRDIPVTAGSVHNYTFTAPIATGGAFPLSGSFDGGGQRPRDVNKFLSYATLTNSRTGVPAGTTTFPLLIFYSPAVIAGSFSATLNGAPITALFNPTPGGFETVSIPLVRGSNVLQLTIDGNLPGRVAADSDRLTFQVP